MQLVLESRAVSSSAAAEVTIPESSRKKSIVSAGSDGVAKSRAIHASSRRPLTLAASDNVSVELSYNTKKCQEENQADATASFVCYIKKTKEIMPREIIYICCANLIINMSAIEINQKVI